jgi:hypothetical protein
MQAITEARPAQGPLTGGNTVALIGYGFTGATAVTIGGKAAAFTVINDAHIDVVIPPRATPGSVDVVVVLSPTRGTAPAPGGYVYVDTPTEAVNPPANEGSEATHVVNQAGQGERIPNPKRAKKVSPDVVLMPRSAVERAAIAIGGGKVTKTQAGAPLAKAYRSTPVAVRMSGLPGRTQVSVRLALGKRFVPLGKGTTSTMGTITGPALVFGKPGTYTLRISGKGFVAHQKVRIS